MFVEIDTLHPKADPRSSENGHHTPRPRARRNLERRQPPTVGGGEPRGWYPFFKAVWEPLVALVLLVPAIPVVLVAALLVKLTSRGPAFYTQTRVGRHGRTFTIYKLRTMVHNCESLTGPRWAIPGDPRVTRVGRFLRLTHIDELPQLLNVLRGQMSLIGPRPERPELVPELERALPRYRERLAVRPGLTGLAQIQLPPDTDLESVRRKLACDLYYIQHLGPWMDLSILLCTVLYMLGAPARLARALFQVPSSAAAERAVPIVLLENASPLGRKSA
ncbi:MAG TPA: sugar transferase [Gemmataceae bacterium]|nr:sugar transferase [Gemmataceae bacterium]